jgi:sulfite dehydrogenase (cytochrome) subunit B
LRRFEKAPVAKAAGALVTVTAIVAAHAAPISSMLPEETVAFKPGPNLDVVQNNCTGRHSADYINTQTRDAKSNRNFFRPR